MCAGKTRAQCARDFLELAQYWKLCGSTLFLAEVRGTPLWTLSEAQWPPLPPPPPPPFYYTPLPPSPPSPFTLPLYLFSTLSLTSPYSVYIVHVCTSPSLLPLPPLPPSSPDGSRSECVASGPRGWCLSPHSLLHGCQRRLLLLRAHCVWRRWRPPCAGDIIATRFP